MEWSVLGTVPLGPSRRAGDTGPVTPADHPVLVTPG